MATIILPGPITGAVSTAGVQLDAIEREVAARCGPFLWDEASSGGTQNTVIVLSLQSTVNNIEYQDMYLLRRGVMKATGEPIPGFDQRDRVRIVKIQNSVDGVLTVDRNWFVYPVDGEALEFHHLHPQNELRKAVQNGLRRCFFVDRSAIPLAAPAFERNLSALAPWITSPSQVYAIQYLPPPGAYAYARDVHWWNTFLTLGDVWLQSQDIFPYTLLVTSRRSHFTWVNGVYTAQGPTQDTDLLAIRFDYAVAAGHIEAWRIARSRMVAAAQEGNAVTQVEAATEFSRRAQEEFQPPTTPRIQFSTPARHYVYDEEAIQVVT